MTDDQKKAISDLISIIQDAKGIMGWIIGTTSIEDNRYWNDRMNDWVDSADNETLEKLRQRIEDNCEFRMLEYGCQ